MTDEPVEPQQVRLEYVDGSLSASLPLLYRGLDDDGCDVWEALAPDERRVRALRVGMMPGRCTINVSVPA